MRIHKDGRAIVSIDDWAARAGPKSSKQWTVNRSAMEVARAWLSSQPEPPREVAQLVESHPDFGLCQEWSAEPEVRLQFDTVRGEPRNTDLLVIAEDRRGPYLIAVEAKADEPFGAVVSDALADAVERRIKEPRSNVLRRIEHLAQAIVGERRPGEVRLGALRYQLLTAAAGAIAEASRRGISRAVLLVHEFWTVATEDANHSANAADLNHFVGRLAHDEMIGCEAGELVGPFTVPGAPLFETVPKLYIGKATRNLRGGSV